MKKNLINSSQTDREPTLDCRVSSAARLMGAAVVLATVASASALTINTSNLADIAAFQTGATVETFDTGLTGLIITSYAGVAVPAGSQFSSRDLTNAAVPAFNSGGATFTNPAANPGTPVGVFNPEGGIAGEVKSQNNVIGPLEVGSTVAFGSGFMEVIFKTPVSKVGFEVTHGSLTLILKDITNTNLAGTDSSVAGTMGNFVGISRGSADIGGITIIGTGATSFTLDNFTFAGSTTTTPPNSVPEGASALNLVLATGFLWHLRRKLNARAK